MEMVRDEMGKEVGTNQEKMVISEAKWNELFGDSDDEEEFKEFDAESEERCECQAEGVVTQ